jgi:hypothetical protein
MVNIALAPSTANHLTTRMLSMMHFSLVPAPVPHTDAAHILDMVLSHNQYHSQGTHIPHHLRPLLVRHLFRGSRDRIVLILVTLEGFQSHHLTLLIVCMVHPMVRCPWAWGLVPHTAPQFPWTLLRLIKGQI